MNFRKHSELIGQHAFLSASKYHWINYDTEKLCTAYANFQAAQKGTLIHDFACQCIRLGQKLPKNKQTLNLYVNDAIGFDMTPEQVLYYSPNCYGTADAISFKNNMLRIHDLKTGVIPAHMEQLEIYAALFCLEYNMQPFDISMELRLYQNCEVVPYTPNPDDISSIMKTIIEFDKLIDRMKQEEG